MYIANDTNIKYKWNRYEYFIKFVYVMFIDG